MATMSTTELLDVFKNMTVLELNEFLKAFEEEFGVTAAAPVAVAAAAGAAAGGGGEAGRGEGRVRRRPRTPPATRRSRSSRRSATLTSLGLKEAKDLVDGAPKPVLEKVVQGRRREGQGPARRGRRHRRAQVVTSATLAHWCGDSRPGRIVPLRGGCQAAGPVVSSPPRSRGRPARRRVWARAMRLAAGMAAGYARRSRVCLLVPFVFLGPCRRALEPARVSVFQRPGRSAVASARPAA